MSPSSLEGDMSPSSLEGDMLPSSLEGDMSPSSLEGDMSPSSLEGDMSPSSLKVTCCHLALEVHPDYHAYCHSKDLTYDVYLFGPPGTNMRQFAEQMHIRSGLTAFDPSTVTHNVYDDFRNSLEQSDRLTYILYLGIALSSTLSPRPPGPRRLPFSAQPPFDLHRRRCLR